MLFKSVFYVLLFFWFFSVCFCYLVFPPGLAGGGCRPGPVRGDTEQRGYVVSPKTESGRAEKNSGAS